MIDCFDSTFERREPSLDHCSRCQLEMAPWQGRIIGLGKNQAARLNSSADSLVIRYRCIEPDLLEEKGKTTKGEGGGGRKRDRKWPRRRGAAGATEAQDRPSVTEICETHRALANGASNPIEIAVGRGDSSKGIIRGPPFPRHREERNSKELWILQIEREIEWILISQPVSWRMKLRSGYLI